ncbi:MAG: hypothetical protein OEZ02_07550, partial [Anaerolineae bacterium]|nr:hypothetical protein [Anaerolineae bacterium]
FTGLDILIIAGLGIILALSAIQVSTKIEYSENTIAEKYLFRPAKIFYWHNIGHVRPKLLGGGFILFDSNGKKLVNLRANQKGAEHFINMLADKRSDLFNIYPPNKIILINLIMQIIHAAYHFFVGIIFPILIIPKNVWVGAEIGIGFLVMGIVRLLVFPLGFSFDKDKMAIKKFLKTREYYINSIHSIDLFPVRFPPGEHTIGVKLASGKFTTIAVTRYSKYMLYLQLRAWFKGVSGEAGIA